MLFQFKSVNTKGLQPRVFVNYKGIFIFIHICIIKPII